ncbi:MAG TPA: hypothetical protein VFE54_00140 [Mucilaginibacter sp.]|jgi:effector-binding domain-containing protein|nr:hypothetical protein [Mucilaginibacter sp.]
MKRKIILAAIVLIILASLFIPVTQQKTVSIKASFLDVYGLLNSPGNWEKWRPDLRKIAAEDSGKIAVTKNNASFTIKYADREIDVKLADGLFYVNDGFDNKMLSYSYSITPIVDNFTNKALVTVSKKTSALNYLVGILGQPAFGDTHVADLKNYMETDSLKYGYRIFKTKVPEANLIVIKHKVLAKDKFTEAAQMFAYLKHYVKMQNAKQMQPVIAQFMLKGRDSAQVNVGFFIDKPIKSDKDMVSTSMPKGGPLYSVRYSGGFDKRANAYTALQQYFGDHHLQSIILPFETYLNNKLPASDTDRVNIQVNRSSYF